MKTCPECNHELVDTAAICKYCGHRLVAPTEPPKITIPEPGDRSQSSNLPPSKAKSFWIGSIIIFAFIVLFFAIKSGIDSTRPNPTPTPEANPITAISMCQEFVLEKLLAPKTADFQNMSDAEVTPFGPSLFIVKSYVDDQNLFGVYIRHKFTCQIRYIGNSSWKLIVPIEFLP